MHPTFGPAEGSHVNVVALIVTPPPGGQFEISAIPNGLAMAWLDRPRNAIPATRYNR